METRKERSKPFFFPLSDEPAPKILFVQHFNLLCDDRMEAWERAIDENVKENDIVLDLGSGTGILSMIAARKAKRVWSVELDPYLAEYSRHAIKSNGFADKIRVINSDARDINLPEKADVIICEMLDTGLIKEQLVQVLNAALHRFSHEGTRIIPEKVFTSARLAYTNFTFSGLYMPLPHFETKEVRKTTEFFSEPVIYHTTDMYRPNPTQVEKEIKIKVNRSGEVNSIKINTDVEVCSGRICQPSHWFNPPLIVPVEPIRVEEGETYSLKISYSLGQGLKTLDYELKKMKTILFINPNLNIRQEATEILQEEGYESVFADNYQEGIEMVKKHLNSLVMVILDIDLLVAEGIEIYDRIKEVNPNLPVVTTSTAGHYRPKLGAEKKLVKFGDGEVKFDTSQEKAAAEKEAVLTGNEDTIS